MTVEDPAEHQLPHGTAFDGAVGEVGEELGGLRRDGVVVLDQLLEVGTPPAAVETSFIDALQLGEHHALVDAVPGVHDDGDPPSSHNDQNGSQYSSKRGGIPAWRM